MERLTQEALIRKWYAHGLEVNRCYREIIKDPQVIGNATVIEWFKTYTPLEGIEAYHVNHDMSKPYIIEYDDEGKAHYPNHSERSYEMYKERYGDSVFADLIRNDMKFHTSKGDELEETWRLPFSAHNYTTAWAELFANASLFGGMETESFKIKKKRLIKALNKRPHD